MAGKRQVEFKLSREGIASNLRGLPWIFLSFIPVMLSAILVIFIDDNVRQFLFGIYPYLPWNEGEALLAAFVVTFAFGSFFTFANSVLLYSRLVPVFKRPEGKTMQLCRIGHALGTVCFLLMFLYIAFIFFAYAFFGLRAAFGRMAGIEWID